MKLTDQKTVRGSTKSFEFSHKSKKLGTITLNVNAINFENAQRKAWKDVAGMYKGQKQTQATA